MIDPLYDSNHIAIYNGDALDVLKQHPDGVFDSVVTDPPYGIGFMGKDWDDFGGIASPQGAYEHVKGFTKLPRNSSAMMREFFVPIWKECLRVMKPGAFAFVMCSPRQDVLCRQIEALEEAGFVIGFSSIYWTYSSGFPKAANIGKKLDTRLGLEGDIVAVKKVVDVQSYGSVGDLYQQVNRLPMKEINVTTRVNEQAKELDGSYGGFQPKPAVEVILVVMKPLSEKTYLDQALKNRKGVTWLEDGRIPMNPTDAEEHANNMGGAYERQKNWTLNDKTDETLAGGWKKPTGLPTPQVAGRFPANLLVSDDALNDGRSIAGGQHNCPAASIYGSERGGGRATKILTDSGSYSRYFDLDKWWEGKIEKLPSNLQDTFPFLITEKASRSEKERGLEHRPSECVNDGRDVLPDTPQQRGTTLRKNTHPTVKPIKLMSYLITLGSRKNDLILDPFVGTGTLLIAARILNRWAVGIDLGLDYCEQAIDRLSQTKRRKIGQ